MDDILAAQEDDAYISVPSHIRHVNDLTHVLVEAHLPGDERLYGDDELLRDARLALWEYELAGGQVLGSPRPVARLVSLGVAA